jgi:hypothetical protein
MAVLIRGESVTGLPKPKATTVKIAPIRIPIRTPQDPMIANAKAALYTPQQLRTIANQQTGAQINAALGSSNIASKAEQAQYAELQNRAAGIAAALGQIGQQTAPGVSAAYNQAAQTVGSLGTGLTGAVASDWQGEQAANQQAVAQALGPGVGQVSSYDPAAMRSALQYTGVTIPGSGLAANAATAGALARYSTDADMAHVSAVSQDYAQQAIDALKQRAAERAQIIAQRPELYQTALESQRQDNARTQAHLDSLVSASATWLQNQRRLRDAEAAQKWGQTHLTPAQKAAQAAQTWSQTHLTPAQKATLAANKLATDRAWWATRVGLTHTLPGTGQPVGGYVEIPVPGHPGQTTVVSLQTAEGIREWQKTFGQTVGQNRQTQALNWTKTNGFKSDWQGKPILDANGKLQPIAGYQLNKAGTGVISSASASKVPGFDERLSKQVGYLVDSNRQPILDANGNQIKYKGTKGTSKQLDPSARAALIAPMAGQVQAWAQGGSDPKTGAPIAKIPVTDAIDNLSASGWFTTALQAQAALNALKTYYQVSPDMVTKYLNGYSVAFQGLEPGGPPAPPAKKKPNWLIAGLEGGARAIASGITLSGFNRITS